MLIVGFAIVFFHLQIQLGDSPADLQPNATLLALGGAPLGVQRASVGEQLWATYLLCITGDFDSSTYSRDPIAGIAFFLLVFIVSIRCTCVQYTHASPCSSSLVLGLGLGLRLG